MLRSTRCALLFLAAGAVLAACGSRVIGDDAAADGGSDAPAIDISSDSLDRQIAPLETGVDTITPDSLPSDGSDIGLDDVRTDTPPPDGATTCTPGATRCSATTPEQIEVCASDGGGWTAGLLCDAAMHQVCTDGACVDRCNSGPLSNLGCEFWPTVTVNSQLTSGFTFAVAVVNPQSYPVSLTITGGALTTPRTQTVAPGESATIPLPWVDGLVQLTRDPTIGCGGAPCLGVSALASHGAYHVQADGPVAAYQFSPLEASGSAGFTYTNDASLLLPTRGLTTHYTVVAKDNWHVRRADNGMLLPYILGGFVSIVGTSATATHVTVNLTAGVSAGTGVTASGPGTRMFTLMQGDVVQLVGVADNEDLTGTTIDADAPIAVFAGHDCTNVPADRAACDHVEEQLVPNEAWGMRAIVTQLRDRGDTEERVVRIVSNGAALHLTFDGIATPADCVRALDRGQHCEFQTAASFGVSGDRPFAAMQFMIGQGPPLPECNSAPIPDACMGDPASALELPVEQYRTSYDVVVPDTYARNFANVTRRVGTSVSLDGVMLTGSAIAAGTGYEVLVVPVTRGRHRIESATAGEGIGVLVYGVAPYTSYMYPGGLSLARISPGT